MRHRIFIPMIVFVGICAGWSILWAITADQVRKRIDSWFANEQAIGRHWACADRSLGGYPFRIEFRCRMPVLTTSISGQDVTAHTGDLLAAANAYQPNLIVASLQSPLTLTSGNDRAEFSWTDLRMSARAGLAGLSDVATEIDHPSLQVTPQDGSPLTGTSDRLEIYARKAGETGAPEVAVKILRGSYAPLDRVTGETDPLDLVLRATISGEGLASKLPLAERLENWRLSGGTFEIQEMQAAKATIRISATGPLSLDDAHRLQGRLALETSGLEPILRRLGVSPAAVSIGSALTSLLPGKTAANKMAPGALRLPVVMANGRVSIGPIRVPVQLLPIY